MSVLKHRHGERTTARHSAPAWPGRRNNDAPISFADIRALPDPDWIGRSQQAGLALDPELLEPLPHADWHAWLADDWTHVNARHDNLADATARKFAAFRSAFEYTPVVITAPMLSELADLTTVLLPGWRQALVVHAEAELALYGAKAEVA